MIWWLANASRANDERSEVCTLSEEVPWLSNVLWKVDDLQLTVEFDITHEDEPFHLKMIYPVVFPEAPPLVLTRDNKRISGHQYGASGELCLEYRPDNWEPDFNGAMMISSAYNLISSERATGLDQQEIRDGHNITIGQEFRAKDMRFLVDIDDLDALNNLRPYILYQSKINNWSTQKKFVAKINSIDDDSSLYTSVGLQPKDVWLSDGVIIHDPDSLISPHKKTDELMLAFEKLGLIEQISDLLKNNNSLYIILGHYKSWTLIWLTESDGELKTYSYDTLHSPPVTARLPESYNELTVKKVGIVGCGSVGSKIATSLARSGIGEFLLFDYDIFFEGNQVRNDLDLDCIGIHKVDALKEKILRINPKAEVKVRRISLGGQESSASTVSALEQLRKCQIIIDSSANNRAFNLIAYISRFHCIPLVWCSVFAGGIGGTVVRCMPNRDPIPSSAKSQVESWYDSQNISWVGK